MNITQLLLADSDYDGLLALENDTVSEPGLITSTASLPKSTPLRTLPLPWNLNAVDARKFWAESFMDRNDHSIDMDKVRSRGNRMGQTEVALYSSFVILFIVLGALMALVVTYAYVQYKAKRVAQIRHDVLMRNFGDVVRMRDSLSNLNALSVKKETELLEPVTPDDERTGKELKDVTQQVTQETLAGETTTDSLKKEDSKPAASAPSTSALAAGLLMQTQIGAQIGQTRVRRTKQEIEEEVISLVRNTTNYHARADKLDLFKYLKRFNM